MIAVLFLFPGQRDLENVAEERWENVCLARDLACSSKLIRMPIHMPLVHILQHMARHA